ncbi:MAG: hypothetical protein EAX96_00145 [Candidatus Lokiarchaeota archaeon]|nr:hypothetical protein [Candidatus Lokiarchaeota archaeon]
MSTEQIFYLIIFITYSLVGILITYNATKVKKTNVYYFGFNLIVNGFIYFVVFLEFTYMQYIVRGFSLVLGLLFTQYTFYQDKKGPFKFFLTFAIISGCIQGVLSILAFFSPFSLLIAVPSLYLADIFFAVTVMINAGWFTHAAFEAYKGVKSFNLEPFQKKRYIIFAVSGLFLIFVGFLFFILMPVLINYMLNPTPVNYVIQLIVQFSIAGFTIVFIILNYLVWVPPKFFRNFLNKGYQGSTEKEEELSEEELMKKLSSGGS